MAHDPNDFDLTAGSLPLTGVRVVDRTNEWGELCSRLLGDLGADVTRVEPIGGSPSRRQAPVRRGISLGWAYRNAGKRIEEIDDTLPAGRVRLHALLAETDVLISSTRVEPEVLERHPDLVVLTITPYGFTGPYADRQATDSVLAATGGQAYKAGATSRHPLPPPGRFCDHVSSATAAFAALCGLRHRRAHGLRSVIDFSVNEALAQMSDWSLPNEMARARAGFPSAVRNGSGPVYPVFRCRDGFVRLVVLSPRQWHAMRAWLGEPDFLQDPELDNFAARFQLADAVLNPLYEAFFADLDMDDVCIEAQNRGIVCTPVLDAAQVLTNAHLAARHSFVSQPIDDSVHASMHAGFFELDSVRVGPRSAPIEPFAARTARARTTTEPRTTASPTSSWPGALDGLRVLDFGHGAVGVEIGRVFAEQGADVIKIESRAYPDFIRLQTGQENTPSFTSSSRSKRSLGINAKSDRGREMLLELAGCSDLVIENNATGVMDGLGLGFDAFSLVNPRIVMVSSQLMGTRGPWAHWRGYGPSTLGPSGVLRLWDYDDTDVPTGGGTIFPDQFAGRLGAVAALAAIIGRESATTPGAHVEVAQIEVAVGAIADLLAAESVEPGSVRPLGAGHETATPWGVYPTRGDDQWVVITCRDDDDWARLTVAIGDASLGAAWTLDERRARRGQIDASIAAWTSGLSKHEAAQRCQDAGVPAGPVLRGGELATDEHLVARGFPVEIAQPDLGPIVLEGPSWHADTMRPAIIEPAPRIGEHTRVVCAELLGLDEPAIDALFDNGVLETTDV
jgi:crotonobetainyl-CoA:carnitine CoA-transferase CaiB-like acyl-CoA transferase